MGLCRARARVFAASAPVRAAAGVRVPPVACAPSDASPANPTPAQDKTPAPLAELDTLMGETYDQLISLADEREAAQSAARSAARALGGGLRLLVQLAAVKLGLGEADAAALREAVHPEVLEDAGAEVGGAQGGF